MGHRKPTKSKTASDKQNSTFTGNIVISNNGREFALVVINPMGGTVAVSGNIISFNNDDYAPPEGSEVYGLIIDNADLKITKGGE